MKVFERDGWQELWSTVRRNRLRTLLTALGVFWGVFMLLVMVGAGGGLERGVKRTMSGFATNSVYVWSERTSLPHLGLQPGRRVIFENGDLDAIRTIPGVEHLAGRNQLGGWRGGKNVSRGDRSAAFQVMGDMPEIQVIQPVALLAGRHLNPLDVAETRKVAVVGRRVQELLFDEGEDALGEAILIQGVWFRVVGVFESTSAGEAGERIASTIHIPFSTFQRAFHYGNQVGWLALTVAPGHRSSDVQAAVLRTLAARHRVAPGDPEALGAFNAEKEFRKVTDLFLGIRVLVWVVGIATLLAGVVGVSNIMLISVKERTREIGIRKALGATPAAIVGQILQESIALTALAGYVGVVAGVGLLELVGAAVKVAARRGAEAMMFEHPQIDLGVALIATAVLVVAGALAGAFPARNAARVDPVIALRSE